MTHRRRRIPNAIRTFCLAAGVLAASPAAAEGAGTELSALQGHWKWQGYNRVLTIDGGQYTIQTMSSDHCGPFQSGPLGELALQYSISGGDLPSYVRLQEIGGINQYRINKLEELPAQCLEHEPVTPLSVFDVFYENIAENYAFLERKGIDWAARLAPYRARINDRTSDLELFGILKEMVSDFGDGHVSVLAGPYESMSDPDSTVPYFNANRPAEAETVMGEFYEAQRHDPDAVVSRPGFETKLRNDISNHIKSHVLNGKFQTGANDLIVWGQTTPDVGYLAIYAMEGLSGAAYGPAVLSEEVSQLSALLDDRIIPFMAGKKAVIVDVRYNGGGYDAVSLTIAGRFADQKRLAFTKQGQDSAGLSEKQSIFVTPKGPLQYTKPVYLLTSSKTASAAEIFTLSMMALPHVTRIGEKTEGSLSDMWIGALPNGWLMSLSNETYLAPDGVSYEGAGIPPQIAVPVFTRNDFWENVTKSVEVANARAK